MTLFVVVGWVILSFGIAGAAHERGRSAFGWFLISITWSPLIAGLFLLLFPAISSIDDHALRGSIRDAERLATAAQQPAQRQRGIGRLVVAIVVLILTTALAVFGVTTMREQNVTDGSQTTTQAETSRNASNGFVAPKRLDYAVVASWPCTKYLNAYGTAQFSSISDPLIETISSRGDGLGSAVNIMSFVATECRLHETVTIGQAVENLFDQQRHNQLPRIPIGGATAEPEVQASWDAFDKWVHHQGPRPTFPPIVRATTAPISVPKSFGGRYCNAIMRFIDQHNEADRNFVSTLPPENPNSPRNSNYKPPYAWRVLSCDETSDPNRVGGMLDVAGGTPWFFEAPKSAYPFPSGGDAIRLAVCREAITRQDDILGVPACRSAGELRRVCERTPRVFKCDGVPDPQGCARRNAICLAELSR